MDLPDFHLHIDPTRRASSRITFLNWNYSFATEDNDVERYTRKWTWSCWTLHKWKIMNFRWTVSRLVFVCQRFSRWFLNRNCRHRWTVNITASIVANAPIFYEALQQRTVKSCNYSLVVKSAAYAAVMASRWLTTSEYTDYLRVITIRAHTILKYHWSSRSYPPSRPLRNRHESRLDFSRCLCRPFITYLIRSNSIGVDMSIISYSLLCT